MPHLLLTHTAAGPIVDVWVTVSKPRLDAITSAGQTPPAPVPCKALVDTGASHTCIDPSVTAALGLTPTGSVQVITPSTGATPVVVETYDVALHIVFSGSQFHSKNPATVSSSALAHQGFSVLLGRDVLADGMLIYDGQHNVFTLAF